MQSILYKVRVAVFIAIWNWNVTVSLFRCNHIPASTGIAGSCLMQQIVVKRWVLCSVTSSFFLFQHWIVWRAERAPHPHILPQSQYRCWRAPQSSEAVSHRLPHTADRTLRSCPGSFWMWAVAEQYFRLRNASTLRKHITGSSLEIFCHVCQWLPRMHSHSSLGIAQLFCRLNNNNMKTPFQSLYWELLSFQKCCLLCPIISEKTLEVAKSLLIPYQHLLEVQFNKNSDVQIEFS